MDFSGNFILFPLVKEFDNWLTSVLPQHNSKMNDPKVFKLGLGNDLGS